MVNKTVSDDCNNYCHYNKSNIKYDKGNRYDENSIDCNGNNNNNYNSNSTTTVNAVAIDNMSVNTNEEIKITKRK